MFQYTYKGLTFCLNGLIPTASCVRYIICILESFIHNAMSGERISLKSLVYDNIVSMIIKYL